jgi:tripartite-type tricarboxylate transporter receptor subunit TctC
MVSGIVSLPASAADYYQGKTLTVMIASKPGGGTDTTARLVARFWGDHIPGKPQVLVRNKGVQVTAANELQHSTRPDGLTVAAFAGSGSLGPVSRKAKSVRYNPLDWGIVGSIDRGPSILLIRKSALERLTDKSKAPVTIGSVSTDRAQDAMTLLGAEALGWNIKFVLGYPSSNQIYLAFERGEVDMFGSGTADIISRFLKGGAAMALAAEVARPDFPKVPTFDKVLGDKKPTGMLWKVYRSWGADTVDKYFAMPPKTQDDHLKIMRESFLASANSEGFRKAAQATLGDGATPVSGDETRERIESAIVIPEDVVATIREIRTKYGLPQLSGKK